MYKRRLAFLLSMLLLLSLAAAPLPQKSVTYERYDVDIDIQADECAGVGGRPAVPFGRLWAWNL